MNRKVQIDKFKEKNLNRKSQKNPIRFKIVLIDRLRADSWAVTVTSLTTQESVRPIN